MNYRQVARKLVALGCEEVPRTGGGSHRKWRNPATSASTTVPDWGSQDLKIGTIRGAIGKLGVDWEEFQKA